MTSAFDATSALRTAIASLMPRAPRSYEHAPRSAAERAMLREEAERHHVLPLLARAAGPAAEPELIASARQTAMRSLAAVETLRRAMAALADAGIPALAWKGPALSHLAWGDPGCRESQDLDIVVSSEQLHAARQALESVGWTRRHALSAAQESAIFRGQGALEMTGPFDPPLLELHWEFSALKYAGRLPVREVLARARPLRIAGAALQTPDAADTLALLAQHGCKHAWGRLEDVAVFSMLAARDPGAVVEAHARAASVGGGRAVRLAVELGARVLGVERPATLAAACARDRAILPLAREVEARWESGEIDSRSSIRWNLRWTDGAADRLRLLRHVALDPTLREWEALRLPDALVGLYSVFRPFRRLWAATRGERPADARPTRR